MKINYEKPDQIKIHCTDKDEWLEAELVSRSDNNIVMSIQNQIRLNFVRLKPGIWVSNFSGYEFVYKESVQ